MATKSAKAYVYGNKEKKRRVAAKKKNAVITDRLTAKSANEDLRIWIQGTKTIGGSKQ